MLLLSSTWPYRGRGLTCGNSYMYRLHDHFQQQALGASVAGGHHQPRFGCLHLVCTASDAPHLGNQGTAVLRRMYIDTALPQDRRSKHTAPKPRSAVLGQARRPQLSGAVAGCCASKAPRHIVEISFAHPPHPSVAAVHRPPGAGEGGAFFPSARALVCRCGYRSALRSPVVNPSGTETEETRYR